MALIINYQNEYGRLKKVALYRPLPNEVDQRNPAISMYVERPDPERVLHEFDGIVEKLQGLGVEVIILESNADSPKTSNMIFLRDVAFAFRDKLVLANMKHPIRQQEPQKFKELLIAADPEFQETFIDLEKSAAMEGADIFAISNNLLYAYTGSRTSNAVTKLLPKIFEGVRVESVKANIHGVPQHILGGVHILDEKTATRRIQYCNDIIAGYNFIDFEEDNETGKGFALNIVTISPGEILMPSGNPATKRKLEAHGVTCHEVPVPEIHKMGGGLACMVLPLWRE